MTAWSPYALEPYRTGRTRRGLGWLAVLAVAGLLWLAYAQSLQESSIDLGDGASGIDVGVPPDDTPKPITVAVKPGQAVLLEEAIGSEGASSRDGGRSALTTAQPYPLLMWLLTWGPIVLTLWLVWKWRQRPAKHEVNFGIYKGAMPLEMISATQRDVVFMRQPAEAPLFGRSRQDYVPWEGDAGASQASREADRGGSPGP